jgi:hypothetical protein
MHPSRQLAIRTRKFQTNAKQAPTGQILQNFVRGQFTALSRMDVEILELLEPHPLILIVKLSYALHGCAKRKRLIRSV